MSEMPLEEEEEEEIDEETSIDGLEGVENSSMKMTRVTLFWRKTKSERCWRLRGNKNDEKSQKRDYRGHIMFFRYSFTYRLPVRSSC